MSELGLWGRSLYGEAELTQASFRLLNETLIIVAAQLEAAHGRGVGYPPDAFVERIFEGFERDARTRELLGILAGAVNR